MTELFALSLLLAPHPKAAGAIANYYRTQEQQREAAQGSRLRVQSIDIQTLSPAALSREPSSTLQLPLTGQVLLSDGRTLTVSGVLDVRITDPTPPPPPPGPMLLAIIREGSTAPLTQGTAGETLVAVGEGLGTDGRLRIANLVAETLSWRPGAISFRVPDPGQRPVTGPVELFAYEQNRWVLKSTLSAFTLQPRSGPLPNPPGEVRPVDVEGYEDEAGRRIDTVAVNRPLVIVGSGFGREKGRVLINKHLVPVSLWTDTRIVTVSGPFSDGTSAAWVDVMTADDRGAGPFRGPRIVGPALVGG